MSKKEERNVKCKSESARESYVITNCQKLFYKLLSDINCEYYNKVRHNDKLKRQNKNEKLLVIVGFDN